MQLTCRKAQAVDILGHVMHTAVNHRVYNSVKLAVPTSVYVACSQRLLARRYVLALEVYRDVWEVAYAANV